MINPTDSLKISQKIADTICRQAIWYEDKCNWTGIYHNSQIANTETVLRALPSNFYVGSAGVAGHSLGPTVRSSCRQTGSTGRTGQTAPHHRHPGRRCASDINVAPVGYLCRQLLPALIGRSGFGRRAAPVASTRHRAAGAATQAPCHNCSSRTGYACNNRNLGRT